jgi:hypothetical protein
VIPIVSDKSNLFQVPSDLENLVTSAPPSSYAQLAIDQVDVWLHISQSETDNLQKQGHASSQIEILNVL